MRYLFWVLLLYPFAIKAQMSDSLTIYYDKDWQPITDTKSGAVFSRKAIKKGDIWYVNDYYRKSGQLQMTGSYLYKLDSLKDGHFKYFYENGKIQSEATYLAGYPTGVWGEWYINGDRKSLKNYDQDYQVGKHLTWWINGKIKSEEYYLEDLEKVKSYETIDSITGKKRFVYGILDGECTYYFENGVISAKETWKDARLVGMEIWNEAGLPETPVVDSNGAFVSEILPQYKYGINGLYKYLIKEIVYPAASRRVNEQGKTIVKFVVEKDGSVSNVLVNKSSGYPLLDLEAVRVVKKMSGDWKPGKQHNQFVRVYYTLPINFKMG